MNLTEQQIYTQVANQEITPAAALEMLTRLNEQTRTVSQPTSEANDSHVTRHPDEAHHSALKRHLEQYLSDTLANLLQLSTTEIDCTENFMELGADSVQLIGLTQQLEKAFNIELYPTLFFEYQNIQGLAYYLSTEYTEVFTKHFGLTQAAEVATKPTITSAVNTLRGEVIHQNQASPAPVNLNPTAPMSLSTVEQTINPNHIAVIGMAGMFASSPNLSTFWENLRAKRDLITEIPANHFDYRPWFDVNSTSYDNMYCKWGSFIEDVAGFDASFFNISSREAELMDPQLRLLLQVLYATTEDAGYSQRIRGTKTGMYVGVCSHDYLDEMARQDKPISPYDGTGNATTMLANRPSFYFNLTGPSFAVDTACSSSLVALHLACQGLRNQECEMAFVAGTNLLLSSWHYRYYCSLGVLSYSGRCHTFDERADGYIPGEGVGALLLKPLAKALADHDQIHAVIRGSAINHGGHASSITAPSTHQEAQVILDAWRDAQIHPDTLGYIEAHGTGTKLGDPVEINGLKKAFQEHHFTQEHSCAIGSAKAHIGHTEGTAGIAGVLKVILSLKHQEIPAMPMFEKLNSYIQLDGTPLYINRDVEAWPRRNHTPRRAGVSSFGFGGAYGHLVLEEYEDQQRLEPRLPSQQPQLVPLSAPSQERLQVRVQQLVEWLTDLNSEKLDTVTLTDLAYTLQTGREAMTERLVMVVTSLAELKTKLTQYLQGQTEIINCYRGNVRTERTKSELLLEGRAGREFMRILMEDRELFKLAQLWVAGIDLDWQLLYPNDQPRRISLPTYPFELKPYWFRPVAPSNGPVNLPTIPTSSEVVNNREEVNRDSTGEQVKSQVEAVNLNSAATGTLQPHGAIATQRNWHLLAIAAPTAEALEKQTTTLVDHLKQQPSLNLSDLVYPRLANPTLIHRRMLVCREVKDTITHLEKLDPTLVITRSYESLTPRSVIFMLAGVGDQYINMGKGLYQTETVFREAITQCCELLKPLLGLDLRDLLYPVAATGQAETSQGSAKPQFDLKKMLNRGTTPADPATQQLNQTLFAQPAVFILEYALSQLLFSWGLKPQAMIGYSLGEYVAACLAGVMSLEDTLKLVTGRAKMIQPLPTGILLAVPRSEAEVIPLLGEELSLAIISTPTQCVVAGPQPAIVKLEEELKAKDILSRRLQATHAFHSQMMKPIAEPFTQLMNQIQLKPPQIPFISNVTGCWITPEQATSPHYWTQHTCQTVRFADGITELLQKMPAPVLIEVGPGQSLGSFVLQNPAIQKVSDRLVLATLRNPSDQRADEAFLLNTLGRLWLTGIE